MNCTDAVPVHRPRPDPSHARAALGVARRERAEHMFAIAEGTLTANDVISAATRDNNKALRRITLRQLLLSQPGWGERRTKQVLSGLAARLEIESVATKGVTIAWLIDPRAGGRRFYAWLDVCQDKAKAPWAGFPYSRQEMVP